MVPFRVGQGYDVHRFELGRELWLGGVKLEYPLGLKGHSDADVLLHAIIDALLGALALRDIGYHFPDNDPKYKGADSRRLLKEVVRLVLQKGYKVGNIDATIVAEQPKINPYVPAMQEVIAQLLSVEVDQVSIKATTNEQMGFTGRQEGILALATALVYRG